MLVRALFVDQRLRRGQWRLTAKWHGDRIFQKTSRFRYPFTDKVT